MKRPSFRALLKKPGPLICPVAHDALSARMIERAGFEATGVAGSAMLAAQHALPDVGLAGMAEMLEGARNMLRGTNLPWGADADDGFGDVRNVVHTVRCFEAAGAGQLVLEDQNRTTKRPGDGGSQTLVTPTEMVAKLRAALESRDDAEYLMIVARTDAALVEGVDGALKRAEHYLAAGADAIFIAGLETPEQLRRVGEALRGAHQIAVVGERRFRHWPAPDELYAMGFGMINYPGLLINRVHAAVADGLDALTRIAAGTTRPFDIPDHIDALEAMAQTLDLSGWEAMNRRFEGA
ncbi:isocitrate lyase/PEP mutase family protein [Blastomonas fulva]|uniref:isocitrate lyase/PEP mutase family protein n=1 Tax=Blastomonas fulva TaxID=1550728 RepID=UPI003F70D6E0